MQEEFENENNLEHNVFEELSSENPMCISSRAALKTAERKKKKSFAENKAEKLNYESVLNYLQSVQKAAYQCCAILCYGWLTTALVLSCREQYLGIDTTKGRAQWLANRLEEMEDKSKKRLTYAYCIETMDGQKRRCCRSGWEFAYGVNSKTKKRTAARTRDPDSKNRTKTQKRKGQTQREMYAAAWLKRFAQACGDQLPFGEVIKQTEIRLPFGNKKWFIEPMQSALRMTQRIC
jgi:hypothetical protein